MPTVLQPSSSSGRTRTQLRSVLRWEVVTATAALGLATVAGISLLILGQQYAQKALPNTTVQGVRIDGLTREEAAATLAAQAPLPNGSNITLRVDDIQISSSSAQLAVENPYPALLDQVFAEQQAQSGLLLGLQVLTSYTKPAHFRAELEYDAASAKEFVTALAAKVDIQGSEPAAQLKISNNPDTIVIHPGEPGRKVSIPETITQLNNQLQAGEFVTEAVVASTSAPLTEAAQIAARERAVRLVGKTLKIWTSEKTLEYADTDLVALLTFPTGYDTDRVSELVTEWESRFNRPPANAVFEYNPETLAVETFVPSRDGLELNHDDAISQMLLALGQLETATTNADPTANTATITLQFVETPPEISLAETNDLGITERIGLGNSEYDHSIPSRIHNVALTANRITNHIVKPGEEFSFNKALGEVSAATGFKPAYVIRAGRTELGDGGGVCQVSSTLFRALLDSGLDITRRLQHSYRVGYYELNSDPGFDATVYAGNVDLRFKNDTRHHVLIHIENDTKELAMQVELYGTSDGRRTEVVDYQKWGAVGAPAPEYILDPTLQPGQKVQIDWAVGGLKTKFTHRVYKSDGELLRENTYYSNYRPWSAKYRVGALP